MKIGIIGSGNIGGSLGRLWAKAGHEVLFSSRHPGRLGELIETAGRGARAGKPEEAMAWADVLLEAVPFAAAMELPADALADKILISASNYYPERDGEIDLGGLTQTGALAARLPRTAVVKAFNMMEAAEIERRAEDETGDLLTIYMAGDDPEAKSLADDLIGAAIFEACDAGPLERGALFETGGPLYGEKIAPGEARARLEAAGG